MLRKALEAGIIACGTAVALGAFGAHGLERIGVKEKYIATWHTGASYQLYHGLALIATGILYAYFPVSSLRWAYLLFIAGIILFSGSLYAITLLSTSDRSIGASGVLTPIGGLCFLAGWGCMLAAVLKKA